MVDFLHFLLKMTKDILQNSRRLWSLAVFQYKQANKEMFLGNFWRLVTPFIQIGVYWLVFGIGLRNGQPIDGVPYVVWLVCGITPWFIINTSISRAASSIYSKAAVLSKSNMLPYLLPVSSVWSVFLSFSWTMGLMLIIYFAKGCIPTWTAFGLIYYLVCALAFLTTLGLINSVLVMLARDFQTVIQLVMRLMFFISPVFWRGAETMPKTFQFFDRLNPIAIILRGFRDSLLFNKWFFQDLPLMVYFWGLVFVLYLLGAALQRKMGKNILDYL